MKIHISYFCANEKAWATLRSERTTAVVSYEEDYSTFTDIASREDILDIEQFVEMDKPDKAYEILEQSFIKNDTSGCSTSGINSAEELSAELPREFSFVASKVFTKLQESIPSRVETSVFTDANSFLVQRDCDGELVNSVMNERELGYYINFSDLYEEDYTIWLISEYGSLTPCHYKGWQPNCLVEVVRDDTNQIVVSYYGQDH